MFSLLNVHYPLLLVCAIIVGWVPSTLVQCSRVDLVNNGYVNLVVAISSETPKTQSDIIIKNIKKIFVEASPILYRASDDRAYFRSVHILIPESWDHIEANLSSWETFEKADVVIELSKNPNHVDTPYTRQVGKCGEPGEKIHLTTSYVSTIAKHKNLRKFGHPGKVFVHEWAHYRYGVFDEYGSVDDQEHPLFYRPQNSVKILPNICTNEEPIFSLRDIKRNSTDCQIDPNTQIYDKYCRFDLDATFQPKSSLASYQYIESVVHFCRDNSSSLTHRIDTPSKHNAMCGGASAWSVIMRSLDFANDKNPPTDLNELPIDFHIVKPSELRIVIAFDVSQCMRYCNRIGKLGHSIRTWIKSDLPSGSKLGMVMFSTMAHIVSELEVISDMKSRHAMMKKVPNELFTGTCLGCGLSLAAQLLAEAGKGGIILLVTAGTNTPGCIDIADVESEILEAGIRVITIAIGNQADSDLERLADLTDGKTYFVQDSDTTQSYKDAFEFALTFQRNIQQNDLYFKLYEKKVKTEKVHRVHGTFNVDNTIGRNLMLSVVDIRDDSLLVSAKLIAPNGLIFDEIEFVDSNAAFVVVELAQPGRWSFKVNFQGKQPDPVLVTVISQLLPNAKTPITTKCWIASGSFVRDPKANPVKIHAEVLKGSNPVLGATVRAYIEKPNQEVEIIDLFDNGANADSTYDDGVYSKYFANITQRGRYSVKCQVGQTSDDYESLGFIVSGKPNLDQNKPTRFRRESPTQKIPLDHFNRITSAGSFKVDVPVSSKDAYPPGDITDLSVLFLQQTETNVSVQLTWTAPGDELDVGTVQSYEIKYSNEAIDLTDSNFDDSSSPSKKRVKSITENNLRAGSLRPEEAGILQWAVVEIANVNRGKPYYIALRAVDKARKVSRVSNMAAFFAPTDDLKIAPDYPKLEVQNNSVQFKSSNRQKEENTFYDEETTEYFDDFSMTDLYDLGVYGIVIFLSTILGIISIICAGAYFFTLHLRKVRRQNESFKSSPDNV